MEPVRFADILFILIVSAVTFTILVLVNRQGEPPEPPQQPDASETPAAGEDSQAPAEDD